MSEPTTAPSLPHHTDILVAFDEVDMYGIVHHSRQLVYLERARIALFTDGGVTPGSLAETDFGLVVVDASMRFHTPARFADRLVVETRVQRLTLVTVTFAYRVFRGDELVLEATTRLAAVDSRGKPRRLPDGARSILANY
jgi:acyl-CoA thioester hydrolase